HYTVNGEPNVSSTQWRSYANIRDLRYYFDMAPAMGIYYVDLNKCDLRKGASVMKFDTGSHMCTVGDITSKMVKTQPFKPMY
ncbi:MAG: hypothetical protein K2J17_05955, partial [Paramuribaculum sp.]|nr:hypothetical protein [Paramuribaculum sp.]